MSATFEQARIKAHTQGHDGTHGSAMSMTRDTWPAPDRRRRCRCGCDSSATHVGGAGGVALTSGCEISMRRWVRDGYQQVDNAVANPLAAACPKCEAPAGSKCRTLTSGWPARFPHAARYDSARSKP